MIKQLPTAAALVLLLSACAGGPPPEPPAPPALDPTGTYDISISVPEAGFELPGVMVIQGSAEEGYTGSIDAGGGGTDLTDILVEGQTMTFLWVGPSAQEVPVQVTFEGDGFSGGMADETGEALISGTKRKGA